MKFLAILGDSFREAVDTKVFTVQVGLGIILVLFLASYSVEPVPAQTAFQQIVVNLNHGRDPAQFGGRVAMAGGGEIDLVPFQFVGVEPLEGAADHPDSPFRVTLSVQFASVALADQVRANPDPTQALLRDQLGNQGNRRVFDVTAVRLAQPNNKLARGTLNTMVAFEIDTRPNGNTRLVWPHYSSLFFGGMSLSGPQAPPLGREIFEIENYLVKGAVAWVSILLGTVITSFFVPNMLRKGSIDLLLVRPIHRVRLLLFKYCGGVVFMMLSFAVLVLTIWLVLGWRTGIWKPGLLLSILAFSFFFAVLYSVSVLCGVTSRNAIVAIMGTCLIWFACWLVGTLYSSIELTRKTREYPEWVYPTVDTLHAVLPRTKDLDLLMTGVLTREFLSEQEIHMMRLDDVASITWGQSLGISAGFVTFMLGLSSWRFYRRDY